MDGTYHTLNETLDDHYNGMCEMIPATALNPNPLEGYQNGLDWFDSLTPSQQEQILGKGKYDLWKTGKLELGDMVKRVQDETYGAMIAEKTLSELE